MIQGGGFDKGEGNSGGFETPSELRFGTSEIECSASWVYIMYIFLTIL